MGDSVLEHKHARRERSERAVARVLRVQLDRIEANLAGALAGEDPESLHDFRVAIRRTRAVQRELASAFAPEPLRNFRDDFRWLQRATSEARDLDVYVDQFDQFREAVREEIRPDLAPLLAVLRQRRADARHRMVDAVSSKRARVLLTGWREFLDRADGLGGPGAEKPIGQLAGRRIAKVYRCMVRDGAKITRRSPAEDYHELRKLGKELRYLLELFGRDLFPAEAVMPMVKTLKSLQDTLGAHQDREVQIATLRSLADAVAATPDSAPALIAIDVLIGRLRQDARQAREEFLTRFGSFASRPRRQLVKATFA